MLGCWVAGLLECWVAGSLSRIDDCLIEQEYKKDNFSLQFCPAYNLTKLHVKSADVWLMSADIL